MVCGYVRASFHTPLAILQFACIGSPAIVKGPWLALDLAHNAWHFSYGLVFTATGVCDFSASFISSSTERRKFL